MGIPTHGPASACSEMSIAALVLAKHARTGLVRAMRGEGGLALAGMAKKASGGRLSSSVWRQAERSAASSGHLEVDVELVERGADAAPKRHVGAPDRPAVRHPR